MASTYGQLKAATLNALSWMPVAIFALDHGFSASTVRGRSMQPTLNPDSASLAKDLLLVSHYAVQTGNIRRGDILTFTSPIDPECRLIKRMVAAEGDYIVPRATSQYAQQIHIDIGASVRIPQGHMWVEGDESLHSRDSNLFGPIPLALVSGKVTAVIWPWSRMRWMSGDTTNFAKRRLYNKA